MFKVCPPPRSWARVTLLIALAAILLGAAPALAQDPSFSNLRVTEIQNDCAWVEWELTGSVSSILVYRHTSSDDIFTNGTFFTLANTARAYEFTDLTAETTYYFGIVGVEGTSTYQSPVFSATTRATTLFTCGATAPSTRPSYASLEVTEIGSNCVWVEWTFGETGSFTEQSAYSNTDANQVFTGSADATPNSSATFYQFTGLSAGTTYYFGIVGRVTATYTIGSGVISATTLAAGGGDCGAADDPPNSRLYPEALFIGSECVWFSWRRAPRIPETPAYRVISLVDGSSDPPVVRDTNEEPPYLIAGLTAGTTYQLTIGATGATEASITVTTAAETTACPASLDPPKPKPVSAGSSDEPWVPTPKPPANTCPELLPDIVISGFVSYGSQCQVVAGAGVGRQDLLDRGVVAAVDVWSLVPSGVEVCFRNLGAAVVFLDAAYSPRLLSTLDYTTREGMTCAMIHTAGTVVLLAS